MKTEDAVKTLREIPETKLIIFELIRELVDENGNLDPVKVSFHSEKVDVAVEQVNTYIAEVRGALACLTTLVQ